MYKNQRGITIVSLVIMVVLILIISSITIYTGRKVINRANHQTIFTNMMLIQAKVKTLAEQAKFNNDTSNYRGTILSSVTTNEKIDKVLNAGAIDDINKYYLLSKEDLKSMGLEKIKIEDGYLVNYETEDIIYVKGFERDGITYYKLSDAKTVKESDIKE